MNTNTSGAALIGDGTNFNPVAISGDITIAANGTAAIGSGVIVNADINASAAIADSKLATISTAGKVDIGALEIDGATDIGAALADADLIIVDDGANGTERKAAMSRVATYVEGGISGDITISSGTAAIGSGVVVNADVSASAAIAFSKMENLTASRALVSDANGDVSVSAVTSTEIGHLDGVTSSIQTQLNSAATVGKAIAMAIVFG
jgi:serine acetyltransferase